MKRVLTAAVGIPFALWAVFRLPDFWFFLLVLSLVQLAVFEYVRLARAWTSKFVLSFLYLAVPGVITILWLSWVSEWSNSFHPPESIIWPMRIGFSTVTCLAVLAATWVLFAGVPAKDAMSSLGSLCFGIPYLALPAVSLCYLQKIDPSLLLLLLAVVWTGDSAAYFIGSRFGRHKLAPTISPNKSWEGAAASLAGALVMVLVWRKFYAQESGLSLVMLALASSVVGQLGDLVESMLKRGAGVKDSGNLLPGHGGVLDRFDALFFAAPVFGLGIFWIDNY